jgi:hypothetical protein
MPTFQPRQRRYKQEAVRTPSHIWFTLALHPTFSYTCHPSSAHIAFLTTINTFYILHNPSMHSPLSSRYWGRKDGIKEETAMGDNRKGKHKSRMGL